MDRTSTAARKGSDTTQCAGRTAPSEPAGNGPAAQTVLPEGIHAAVVLPLNSDFTIDEDGYKRQLDHVLEQAGMHGLLVNGHASENHLTSREEKVRVVELTRNHAGSGVSITSGVYAERSEDAADQARALEAASADALLVFQPFSWSLGVETGTVVNHHRIIHDAVGAPILFYQAPAGAGHLVYPIDVIDELIKLERLRGVKDGSWEIATTEILERHISRKRPEVLFFGSGDEHLLVNYLIGTFGSQVSLAAVIPELICRLWDAAADGDWTAAKAFHDRIQPLANLIYRRSPATRSVARLKACLVILGIIDRPLVRAPLVALPDNEYDDLRHALTRASGRD